LGILDAFDNVLVQRGTHSRWPMVAKDGTGAQTLSDIGASFAIATGGVLTLFIATSPNGGSVWVRVVDEVSGAVFEQEISADMPATTQFLSPRLYMNNGPLQRPSLTTARGSSGLTGTKESEFGFRCISGCAIEGDAHRNWVYRIAR